MEFEKHIFGLFIISNGVFDMLRDSDKMRIKILAKNLIRLRKERGFSLTGLAERAGISKSTLSSLEAGQANPTISTLWALADALEVPFGALVAESEDVSVEVSETGVSVRLIEQSDDIPKIEVYLMRLSPGGMREAAPHSTGVAECVFILKGRMLVGPSNSPKLLRAGETISFKADQPHVYIAMDEPVSALVTVEYPKEDVFNDPYTVLRPAPRNEEEWENVFVLLRRLWEDVAQGLPVFRFRLLAPENSIAEVVAELKKLLSRLKNSSYSPALKYFVVKESGGVSLFTFVWPRGRVQLESFSVEGNDLLNQAARIQLLAQRKDLPEDVVEHLRTLSNSHSLTLSTLAAETLLHHGRPTVPQQIYTFLKQDVVENNANKSKHTPPEDVYSAFEILRPGYARQPVALVQMLHRYLEDSQPSVLDVGSSVYHLTMFSELFPGLDVTTVDTRNLPKVDFPERFSVVLSVGCSHVNTAFFLQKAYDLLDDRGLLLVSEDFFSPYRTSFERACEIIRHHTAYMLPTLVEIPKDVRKNLTHEESFLVDKLSKDVPLLAYLAEIGMVEAAISRVYHLFSGLRSLNIPVQPTHSLIAFYHFQILELKALVAGLDCKVHRTFPERFLTLAEAVGFRLLEHRKVYASDNGEMGGGTHVFAFRKEV